MVYRLVCEKKSVIIFRETRGEARGCAAYLADSLGFPSAEGALKLLPESDPSLSSSALRRTLERGVGFHISDLDPEERQVVEEQFRAATTLKVLAATTTLAMGINTPAEAVIVAGLQHPGNVPYSIAEYKNIVGRVGRLGFATRGTSFLIALDHMTEHYLWTRYVLGIPEDLTSQFLQGDTDPRTLMLRVLATADHAGKGMTAEDIVGFLEASFGSFLQKRLVPSWNWDRPALANSLKELSIHRLIETDSDGLHHLTPLGSLSGVSGIEVESIIRLVEGFTGLTSMTISDPTLLASCQLTVELDQVLFPINKKSTQKEPQAWFGQLRNQRVPHSVLHALQRRVQTQHQPTLRAKKAVACLLWISGRSMAEIEDILTQFGGKFDGAAGPMRSVRSRTCDVLPTVTKVAELLNPGLDLAPRVSRLLVRLELGIPSEAVSLAMSTKDRLNRGDYLSLAAAGLCDYARISAADDGLLLSKVGGSRGKLETLRKAVFQHEKSQQDNMPNLPPYTP
jgi:helicase